MIPLKIIDKSEVLYDHIIMRLLRFIKCSKKKKKKSLFILNHDFNQNNIGKYKKKMEHKINTDPMQLYLNWLKIGISL